MSTTFTPTNTTHEHLPSHASGRLDDSNKRASTWLSATTKPIGKIWYVLTLASPTREIELLVKEAKDRANKPWFKNPPTDVV